MKAFKMNSETARKQYRRAALAAVLAACGTASVVDAQIQYTGATSAVGSAPTNLWSVGSNWLGGVAPNGIDQVAGFAQGVTTEVEVDGNYTIGGMVFNNPAEVGANFTFPTKPTSFDVTKSLTFAVSSGVPSIEVQPAAANVFFYNTLLGNQGIEKKGKGKLTFRFNPNDQTYTGNVLISGGVFGIQKNGSLGDSNNDIFIGAVDGLSTTAILIAEPSDNTVVSLPTTRDVTLAGAGAGFSSGNPANDQRQRLVVNGNVTDGANSFGLSITQGYVALTGTNTYDGVTTISGGALVAAGPASLPGYNVAGRVNATGSLIGRVGGAGEFTVADIDSMKVGTFAAASALGIDTTNATGPVDWAGLTAGEAYSIAKSGPGTLRLTGVNNYTGTRARIYEGTLALASGASLPTNITAIFFRTPDNSPVTLDLGGNTQQIAGISAASGGTSKVTNGSLLYKNSAANFDVSNALTNTVVDLRGLTAFTYDSSTGTGGTPDAGTRALRVIPATDAAAAIINELYLASGSNLAKVNAVQIGAAAGTSQGPTHEGRLFLGTSNEFRIAGATGAFTLGGFNGTGRASFQTGLTSPSLKLRGADGVANLPILKIGECSSGSRNGGGTLDLTGGSADINVTDLFINRHIAASIFTNGDSALTVDGGTVNAGTITMAEKQNGGAAAMNAFLNIKAGTVNAGTIIMGQALVSTGTTTLDATFNPTINVSGGTLAAGIISPTTGAGAATFNEATSARTINLTGGTLRPLTATSDLTITGTTAKDADPATTGNMIIVRVPAGAPNIYADSGRKVTLTDTTMLAGSTGTTSTVGTLVKTGPGGLQINGAISNDLPIRVDAGAVQVSNGATPTRADVNATLVVDYTGTSALSAVLANIAAGYNGGAWNGAGYISSGAAASSSPKTGLAYFEKSALLGAGSSTIAGLTVDDTSVIVKYTVAGDATVDSVVNLDDFTALAGNFGLGGAWTTGDFNYDQVVNLDDFTILAGNFGLSVPADAPRSAVPEPSAITLLAAALPLLRRRRQQA